MAPGWKAGKREAYLNPKEKPQSEFKLFHCDSSGAQRNFHSAYSIGSRLPEYQERLVLIHSKKKLTYILHGVQKKEHLAPIWSGISEFTVLGLDRSSKLIILLTKSNNTHCSRITRYPSFISQDFFHFSSFIHNVDNLNM